MAKQVTTHDKELVNLRRIEGQVRGIIKMIEEKRYCIDILSQLSAVRNALSRVEEHILEKHIRGCVVHAFKGSSRADKDKKIREVMEILAQFRRGK
ncbi:MAG: metal-sensitive transcriptional regulator [Candidatus Tritonobacter lacicola]|nr:metal-sensitive transcriptional regulator [Candidatus Tritonobacter lacicola]